MSIPKGWNLIALEKIATVQRGKFSVRPRNDPRYYGGTTPFVQTGDVASSKGRLDSYTQTLNEEGVKVSKVFPKGTILVTIAANIGDVALTEFEVAIPDSLVAINPSDKADVKWLFQYLITQKEVLDGLATQNAQKNINLQVLQPLQILVPPIREQCRIAEILGVWDESIDLLEKLITTKHKLKQVLVRQLLTGKKKFKEFESNEWREGFISDLIKSLNAGVSVNSEDRHIKKNELGILKTSAVTYGIFLPDEHKAILPAEVSKAVVNPRKDRIIISRMNTPKLVGASVYISKDYPSLFLPDRLWQAEPKSNGFSMKWLSYVLSSNIYREKISSLATGTSNSMKNISKASILKMSISIPHKLEQEKIAAVLSAADTEISTLEKQLAAYKEQKRGLMQQLLTGRTRILGLEDEEDKEQK